MSAACRKSGVSRANFYKWKAQSGAFAEALEEARTEALEALEEHAWNRAVGFEVVREKHEILRDRRGSALLDHAGRPRMVLTERIVTREYDGGLLRFLLGALAPEKYRERVSISHSGQIGLELITIDEAIARIETNEVTGEGDDAAPTLPPGPAARTFTEATQRRVLRP